ncbi:chalcone isomerase family protein [Methylophaga thiooxydans]|uniref:chalcone isomerase family protein n=1 Tax=Methylophaga thiooxydans TaxID=392484 RepID=UPI00235312B9|nr:chalcone isomerase family protein [Methylophaga thiooxydans]
MIKQLSLLIGITCFSFSASAEGFPDYISMDGKQLQQCSKTAIKVLKFIDVGQAALFTSDCGKLPNLTSSLQLSFIYHRDFDADDFVEASETLLQRNLTASQYAEIQNELDVFNQSYQSVVEGDRYDIRLNQQGLFLIKNGTQLSHSSSQLLGKHYYQIWFGAKPFNQNLKQALLQTE